MSVGRAAKNNLFSLTDAALANVSVPLAALRFALRSIGASTRATLAETALALGKALETSEAQAALGPEVTAELRAAVASPATLRSTLERLARANAVVAAMATQREQPKP